MGCPPIRLPLFKLTLRNRDTMSLKGYLESWLESVSQLVNPTCRPKWWELDPWVRESAGLLRERSRCAGRGRVKSPCRQRRGGAAASVPDCAPGSKLQFSLCAAVSHFYEISLPLFKPIWVDFYSLQLIITKTSGKLNTPVPDRNEGW